MKTIKTSRGRYVIHHLTPFVEGQKTLVCLHGFMGDSHTFDFLKEQRSWNVLGIDLMGHGESEISHNGQDYTLESMVHSLKEILMEMSLDTIYLLGYSFGGRVALTFSNLYPDSVTHLILESASLGIQQVSEKESRLSHDRQLAEKIREEGMATFVDYWQQLPLFASQLFLTEQVREKEILRKKRQNKEAMALAIEYGSVATQRNFFGHPLLKDLSVTYIAGKLDSKYASLAKKLAKETKIETILVDNAGHCVHLEKPKFFQEILYAILEEKTVVIQSVQSSTYDLELISPFVTSYGQTYQKPSDIFIVTDTNGFQGYGELLSFETPDYIEETIQNDRLIIKHHLLPLLKGKKLYSPRQIRDIFQVVKGNQMAKSAIETAIWDLFAKIKGESLKSYLGLTAKEVKVGVSIGIQENESQLLEVVTGYVNEGYQRVKIKISPEKDLSYIKRIREAFPDLLLMVDANSCYHLTDTLHLKKMNDFHLAMIEQPLGTTDFYEHAILQKQIETPICLDENIRSLGDVKLAHHLNSAKVINLKIPRVGGLSEALDILDYCQQNQLDVWLGGMFESGVGRSLNLILATHPYFTFPGDLSASNRYYKEDTIEESFSLVNGTMSPLDGLGIGITLKESAKLITTYFE